MERRCREHSASELRLSSRPGAARTQRPGPQCHRLREQAGRARDAGLDPQGEKWRGLMEEEEAEN